MLLRTIALIIGALFEIYVIYKFLNSFWDKKKINNIYYKLTMLCLTIFHILISLFCKGIILTTLAFFTGYLMSQLFISKQYVKILTSILLTIVNGSGELLIGGLFMLISDKTHSEVNTTPEGYALGILVSKFFAFVIVTIICSKSSKLEITYLNRKDKVVLSILPITTTLVCIFSFQTIYSIEASFYKTIYILLNFLLIISNIITFEIINNQNKLAQSDYELNIIKNTLNEQEKHYKELQKSQEEIRGLHHDMKNTYISMIAAVESGDTENVLEKLKSDLNYINLSSRFINTGHISIDTILEAKLKECEEQKINHKLSFNYKSNILVNEIEVAIIIGNILDNAIEASIRLQQSKKEIWGTITSDKDSIIITIKNFSEKPMSLSSYKKDKKNHGFGLKNINHIADKYHGYTNFTYNEGIFTSFIVLDNSTEE